MNNSSNSNLTEIFYMNNHQLNHFSTTNNLANKQQIEAIAASSSSFSASSSSSSSSASSSSSQSNTASVLSKDSLRILANTSPTVESASQNEQAIMRKITINASSSSPSTSLQEKSMKNSLTSKYIYESNNKPSQHQHSLISTQHHHATYAFNSMPHADETNSNKMQPTNRLEQSPLSIPYASSVMKNKKEANEEDRSDNDDDEDDDYKDDIVDECSIFRSINNKNAYDNLSNDKELLLLSSNSDIEKKRRRKKMLNGCRTEEIENNKAIASSSSKKQQASNENDFENSNGSKSINKTTETDAALELIKANTLPSTLKSFNVSTIVSNNSSYNRNMNTTITIKQKQIDEQKYAKSVTNASKPKKKNPPRLPMKSLANESMLTAANNYSNIEDYLSNTTNSIYNSTSLNTNNNQNSLKTTTNFSFNNYLNDRERLDSIEESFDLSDETNILSLCSSSSSASSVQQIAASNPSTTNRLAVVASANKTCKESPPLKRAHGIDDLHAMSEHNPTFKTNQNEIDSTVTSGSAMTFLKCGQVAGTNEDNLEDDTQSSSVLSLSPSTASSSPQTDYIEENKIIICGINVRAAKLPKLIQILIESFDESGDVLTNIDFPRVFLLMHKWFMESESLSSMLYDSYLRFDEEKNSSSQFKICNVFRYWINKFPFHFALDYILVESIKRFSCLLQIKGHKDQLKLLDTSKIESFDWLRKPTTKNHLKPKQKIALAFDKLDAEVIANQLTFLEWKTLRRISFSDYKSYAIKGTIVNNQPLERSIQLFNGLSQWIQCMILNKTTPKQRSDIIHKFLEVAQHLKQLLNFNSLMAVVGGICHSAISRLYKTNLHLSMDDQKILNDLTELLSSNCNYGQYRKATHEISQQNKFWIPIVGIHLKDIISLHTAHPDKLENDLINFRKMTQLSVIFQSVADLQNSLPPVQENRDLIKLLQLSLDMCYTEDEIYELSYAREPRTSVSSPCTPSRTTPGFADWAKSMSTPPDPQTIQKHVNSMADAVFKNYDHDRDGFISKEEFNEIAQNFPFIDSFAVLDADKDGLISRSEMKNYFLRANHHALKSEFKHEFHETTYFKPSFCSFCNGFLWGLIKQGWKCKDCGINAHRLCIDQIVMECRPKRSYNIRQTSHPLASNEKFFNRSVSHQPQNKHHHNDHPKLKQKSTQTETYEDDEEFYMSDDSMTSNEDQHFNSSTLIDGDGHHGAKSSLLYANTIGRNSSTSSYNNKKSPKRRRKSLPSQCCAVDEPSPPPSSTNITLIPRGPLICSNNMDNNLDGWLPVERYIYPFVSSNPNELTKNDAIIKDISSSAILKGTDLTSNSDNLSDTSCSTLNTIIANENLTPIPIAPAAVIIPESTKPNTKISNLLLKPTQSNPMPIPTTSPRPIIKQYTPDYKTSLITTTSNYKQSNIVNKPSLFSFKQSAPLVVEAPKLNVATIVLNTSQMFKSNENAINDKNQVSLSYSPQSNATSLPKVLPLNESKPSEMLPISDLSTVFNRKRLQSNDFDMNYLKTRNLKSSISVDQAEMVITTITPTTTTTTSSNEDEEDVLKQVDNDVFLKLQEAEKEREKLARENAKIKQELESANAQITSLKEKMSTIKLIDETSSNGSSNQ